ncbi:MAG: c-type cytochrome biogenesis protein CcsB [Desulfococcaceae bacterium]
MDFLIIGILFLYLLSTVGYFAYLFLQKDWFHKAGYCLMGVGFLCHTALIGWATVRSGLFPIHNLHQILSLSAWAVSGFFLFFQHQFRLRIMGIYAAPLAVFLMILSSRLPVEPEHINNTFKSFWAILHVTAILISYASFALACGAGILYLVQEHAIKSKKRGFFYSRLPSLEMLDSTGYACIITGFTMVTLGLISGFVYAKLIWGKFWSWDPKEVWSGILWVFYAVLLHERLTVGWRGRKSAIMSIIGFAVLVFTFIGVNFLLKGHHGEFTKW